MGFNSAFKGLMYKLELGVAHLYRDLAKNWSTGLQIRPGEKCF